MAPGAPSAKRIAKELAEIALDPPTNCSAGPKGDNLYEWTSTIIGPSGEWLARCAQGGGAPQPALPWVLLV